MAWPYLCEGTRNCDGDLEDFRCKECAWEMPESERIALRLIKQTIDEYIQAGKDFEDSVLMAPFIITKLREHDLLLADDGTAQKRCADAVNLWKGGVDDWRRWDPVEQAIYNHLGYYKVIKLD